MLNTRSGRRQKNKWLLAVNSSDTNILLLEAEKCCMHRYTHGLEGEQAFNTISDQQLDTVAQDYTFNNPRSGERSFEGY